MSKSVLIAAPAHKVLTDGLMALGYSLKVKEDITQEMAYELIEDVVGVITSTRIQLDKQLLDRALNLQWIGRMGSGMEVVDVPYAKEKGIQLFSSPDGNNNAVAEQAVGMLLSLTHRIVVSNNEVRNGVWEREGNRGTELEGKTIGIIGCGHTGSALARKLSVFDMTIFTYDKYKSGLGNAYISQCDDLERIYEEADILSFHVPLTDETYHYFNEGFLNKMRKPFILVNTSRGKVVDSKTLLYGLEQKKILGACLDVQEVEPPFNANEELRNIMKKIIENTNVVSTPHIAGYTHEALFKMSKILLQYVKNRANA